MGVLWFRSVFAVMAGIILACQGAMPAGLGGPAIPGRLVHMPNHYGPVTGPSRPASLAPCPITTTLPPASAP